MEADGIIKLDAIQPELTHNVSLYAAAVISPLASFWGGIIA